MQEMEAFKARYPTAGELIAKFAPANWPKAIMAANDYATMPAVAMAQVDKMYNAQGLATQLLRNQLCGIYKHTPAKQSYDDSMIELTAQMFLAKYGYQCTPYSMMVYFGNYIIEYKTTYSSFDTQDIMQQYKAKFLPWWNKLGCKDIQQNQHQQKKSKVVGKEAMYQYLSGRLLAGESIEDVRNCNLAKIGFVTEKDWEKIQEIAMNVF